MDIFKIIKTDKDYTIHISVYNKEQPLSPEAEFVVVSKFKYRGTKAQDIDSEGEYLLFSGSAFCKLPASAFLRQDGDNLFFKLG